MKILKSALTPALFSSLFLVSEAAAAVASNSFVQFSTTNYYVSENVGGGQAVIFVTRTGPSTNTSTVSYSTSPGTATPGTDYTNVSGTVTLFPGQTSTNFAVPLIDDGTVETNETVNLSLSNPVGATLGSPSSAILTIFDNDTAPPTNTVQFTTGSYAGSEGAGVFLTVTRSGNTSGAASVDWSVTGGTASAGTDYTGGPGGTLNFSPGETFEDIQLTLIDDLLVESNETVNLALTNPMGATLDSPSSAVLTIFDNDTAPPTNSVHFFTDAYGGSEDMGLVFLTVTRSGNVSGAASVDWTVIGGSASPGADYTGGPGGTLNFGPGQTFEDIQLTLIDDALVESNETVNLALSNPMGATLGSPSSAILTIFDNDTAPPTNSVQFITDTYGRTENMGLISLTVTRSGDTNVAASVQWSITGGSAMAGNDYTGGPGGTLNFGPGETFKNIELTLVDDALVESNETVNLALSNPMGATLGSPSNAVLTIFDNDVTYTVMGQVRDCMTNGPGLPGVTLTLTGMMMTNITTTSTNGNYAFSNVMTGTYTITPSRTNYSFLPTNATVNVTNHTTVTNFVGFSFVVRGLVREGTNAPVMPLPGVLLTLMSTNGSFMRTNITDTNGLYLFTNVPPNVYKLTVFTNGYTFMPTNLVMLALTNSLSLTNCTNVVNFVGTTKRILLVALEVNQAVQDWSNSVPLIQDKPTLVRAHLQLVGTNTNAVVVSSARLEVKRGGTVLTNLSALNNPGGNLTIDWTNANAVRSNLAQSLNFMLPSSVLNGMLELRFGWTSGVVICAEPKEALVAGAPSNCIVNVAFQVMPELRVRVVRVRWTNATVHQATGAQVTELEERLKAIYPIARLSNHRGEVHWSAARGAPDDEPQLNSLLAMMRLLDGSFFGDGVPLAWRRLYYGLVVDNVLRGQAMGIPSFVSCGSYPDTNSFGHPFDYQRNLHAHEMGHSLGRHHAVHSTFGGGGSKRGRCNEFAAATAPDFPMFLYNPMFVYHSSTSWPTLGPLAEGANRLAFGYDHHAKAVVNPLWTFDLMSYCPPGVSNPPPFTDAVWISKHTYTNLIDIILTNRAGGGGAAAAAAAMGPPQDYLVFRGIIDLESGATELQPFTLMTSVSQPPSSPPGDYTLRLLDSIGGIILDVPFEPEAGPRENPTDEIEEPVPGVFVIPVPFDPDISQAIILHDNVPLISRTRSAHPPTVQVLSPNGGENLGAGPITLHWSADDLDGDVLSYVVLYSPDNGMTWETLTVDWPEESLELSGDALRASAQGRIRVIASDGFLGGADESDGTFSVENHPPEVVLEVPVAGEFFNREQQIVFEASANDLENGALEGASLQWSSSLDGPLGAGAMLLREASSLSEGTHIINVTAMDSAGLSATASVKIQVFHTDLPVLHIARDNGQVILSWPGSLTSYLLEATANLSSPNWMTVTNQPVAAGDEWTVTLETPGNSSFYRLKKM